MKKIITLTFLLVSLMSFSQDKKPKYYKFKDGVFYSTHINKEGETDTLIIRRKGDVQTESTLIDGKEEVVENLKVIWVNDSKYILRVTTLISDSKKIRPSDVVCKIIETGDGYYVVKAWIKGSDKITLRLNIYSED